MKSNGSRTRSAKQVRFEPELLLRSLRGHADHLEAKKKLTLRTNTVVLPARVNSIRRQDIVAIRKQLNVSQPVFAALLNVPLSTARSWEQGTRKPSGAALRLLDLARRRPNILLAA